MAVFQNSNRDITTTIANGVGNLSVVGNLWTSANAYISGNLTVDGDVTYINITELNVEDPIISMGRGPNNAPLTSNDGKDRGEAMWYYTTQEQIAFVGYKNDQGNLFAAANVTIANEIVTVHDYGNFVTGNVYGNYMYANLVISELALIGANKEVLFNGPNVVSSDEAFTFDSATGNLIAPLFVGNSQGWVFDDSGTTMIEGNSRALFGNSVSIAGPIGAAGNISSNEYFIGDGRYIANIYKIDNNTSNVKIESANSNVTVGVDGTGNVVVIANTGMYVSGEVSASGNVTGNYILGNGVYFTGRPPGYSNANVDAYLPIYSGNISANIINVTNNISANVVSASGNVTGANLNTAGQVSGKDISASGNVQVDGYLSVVGNLYVANIVSTSNLVVQDPLVYFTSNATYPYNYDIGFYSHFQTSPGNPTVANGYQTTGFVRDYADNTWKLFSNLAEPTVTSFNFANAVYDSLRVGNLNASLVSASGNITGNYILGNGSQLTGLPQQYSNSNVSSFLASFGSNTISTTGNITGSYFFGNASQMSGLPVGLVGATGPNTYDLTNFINGQPLANEVIMRTISVRSWSIADSFTGSLAYVTTPATVNPVKIVVQKNGANIGNITFATSSLTGTFAGASGGVAFNSGDQILMYVDNITYPVNASFSDFAFTIKGTASS